MINITVLTIQRSVRSWTRDGMKRTRKGCFGGSDDEKKVRKNSEVLMDKEGVIRDFRPWKRTKIVRTKKEKKERN